ncbi:MAG: hypothetical protein IEMM0002_1563 [bacterium]|nr:MAG: hypothetical protein IEMM0002_1563 [bacterium]
MPAIYKGFSIMLVMVSCHPELFAVSLPNGRRTNHDKLPFDKLRVTTGNPTPFVPLPENFRGGEVCRESDFFGIFKLMHYRKMEASLEYRS